jgi:hypothetical protein
MGMHAATRDVPREVSSALESACSQLQECQSIRRRHIRPPEDAFECREVEDLVQHSFAVELERIWWVSGGCLDPVGDGQFAIHRSDGGAGETDQLTYERGMESGRRKKAYTI